MHSRRYARAKRIVRESSNNELTMSGEFEYHEHLCIRWKVNSAIDFYFTDSPNFRFRNYDFKLRLVKPMNTSLLLLYCQHPMLDGVHEIETFLVDKNGGKVHRTTKFLTNDSKWCEELWKIDRKVISSNLDILLTNGMFHFVCVFNYPHSRCQVNNRLMSDFQVQTHQSDLRGALQASSVDSEFDELLLWKPPNPSLGKEYASFFEAIKVIRDEIIPTPELLSSAETAITIVASTDPSLEEFSAEISKLYTTGDDADVRLECGDQTVLCHKLVLSARSDVFAAMFRNDMAECREGVIRIQDFEFKIVDILLRYIYSGKVDDVTGDAAIQLYKAADKYAVHSLKRKCATFIVNGLLSENACDALVLADLHSDEDLKGRVISYLRKQQDFLLSSEWADFTKVNPALAVEVYDAFVRDLSLNP